MTWKELSKNYRRELLYETFARVRNRNFGDIEVRGHWLQGGRRGDEVVIVDPEGRQYRDRVKKFKRRYRRDSAGFI